MRKFFLLTSSLLMLACSVSAADHDWWKKPYIPRDQAVPLSGRKLIQAQELIIQIPGLGIYPIGHELEKTSLDGQWRFSGVRTAELPFPQICPDSEKKYAAVDFADSKWEWMKVPHNWWKDGKYEYRKIFRPSKKLNIKSQAYNRRTSNPYCLAWYRHTIDIGAKKNGRVFLNFTTVGYEYELFINGKFVGRHHGDFCPWKTDVTDYVKPGKNLLALRVLADLGPHDEIYTHVYGAAWTNSCIRAGIWNHVFLEKDRSICPVEKMLLVPDHTGNLKIYYSVRNYTKTAMKVTPGIAVRFAEKGGPHPSAKEFPTILLKPGLNEGVFEIQEKEAKPWSPDAPHLYFCSLYFRQGKHVIGSRIERFGFRDFTVRGKEFLLNGHPIFISMETAQAMGFSGDEGNPVERIRIYKVKGVNMLRTAHQPATYQLMDAADEMGMMIWNEWAFSGIGGMIMPKVFAKNTLEELKGFILRDHNHPCVVMWQLGNEVEHRTNPETRKLLNDQVGLVRKLDQQKRPVCAFAGNGNLHHYGFDKIDTDIIDYHLYTGITRPALRWDDDISRYISMTSKVYGKNGKMNMPVTVSESIGGGWGHHPDRKYKHGNVDQYVEIMNRSFYWGMPLAQGYSGVIGLRALNDVSAQYKMIWNLNGTRIIEMVRQDPRISLFATWIGHPTENTARWTQPAYGGIRLASNKKFPVLQYFAPGKKKINVFFINQGEKILQNAALRIDIAGKGKIVPLTVISFGKMEQGTRKEKDIELNLPELAEGRWEIRLTVLDQGKETGGRNSYSVMLHHMKNAAAPIAKAQRVLLLGNHPGTIRILKDLQIPFDIFNGKQSYSKYKCIVIAPDCPKKEIQSAAVRAWVGNGGRLLILEQKFGAVPVMKEYNYSKGENTMTEIVVEKHPVFRNLTQADFDIWAENPGANIIMNIISPLDTTVLAAKGHFLDEKEAGNALSEIKVGQGRVMLSQIMAVNLWKVNPAATCYLKNLLSYLTAPKELYKDVRECRNQVKNNFSIARERVHFIDLRKKCNNTLADQKEGDGIGFTDQGPLSDLRELPRGRIEAAGVPFELIKTDKHQKADCITLSGGRVKKLSFSVKGIPVGKKVNSITFLHTAGFAGPAGKKAANYIIHYKDGSKQIYPVVVAKNIGDWWSPSSKPEAIACMTVKNGLGARVGLYAARWINPFPEKEVASFDLADGSVGPVLILAAATAELVHPEPLTLYTEKKPHFSGAADFGGDRASHKTMQENKQYFQHIVMPASKGRGYSALVMFIFPNKKVLDNNKYDYLSFWYRSKDREKVDVMISCIDRKSQRITSFNLQDSQGEWKFIRLHIRDDFDLHGSDFEIQSMRKEIILYNGRNKKAGWPRRKIEFDIRNIRLE